MLLPLDMLLPTNFAASPGHANPPVHAAIPGACCSLLGMLLPPGLAAPLEKGLQLGQSALKQVAPAYH